MNAMVYREYGEANVLEFAELETPIPQDDEVLIKIHATAVNPLDWKFRSGKVFIARLMSGLSKPKNPLLGIELSGEIIKTGKAVKLFHEKDKVFAMTKGGGYAQFICLPENEVLSMPSNMSFEEAASVPVGATSAYHWLVKDGNIRKRQNILINGASGGVGIFAVQLAKHFGADVTGVCSKANVKMVESLGADMVIDYTQKDFLSTNEKFDIILDVVGKSTFTKCKPLLKDKGIYITTIVTFSILLQMLGTSRSKGKRAIISMPTTPMDNLKALRALIEDGKLKTFVGKKYPLSEVADAHRYAETGHAKGKVVIAIGLREDNESFNFNK